MPCSRYSCQTTFEILYIQYSHVLTHDSPITDVDNYFFGTDGSDDRVVMVFNLRVVLYVRFIFVVGSSERLLTLSIGTLLLAGRTAIVTVVVVVCATRAQRATLDGAVVGGTTTMRTECSVFIPFHTAQGVHPVHPGCHHTGSNRKGKKTQRTNYHRYL